MARVVTARRIVVIPLLVFALVGLGTSAYAACPPIFPPPGYTILPDDDAQVFLMYSEQDRTETLVIQPEFSGTATEFGMVMPLPDRPAINEAPEDMFDVLLRYTTIRYDDTRTLEEALVTQQGGPSDAGVVVVEKKDVGDFTTIVLTAETADALVEWLNGNGFEFKTEDRENFEYYVGKGGYYFVAMKVNMDRADVDDDGGMINGNLRPIEFVFESEYPMLPLRIMAHDMDPMSFTLYTLGSFPYYVPGVDVLFMDLIDKPASPEATVSPSGATQEPPQGITRQVSWSPATIDVQYLGNVGDGNVVDPPPRPDEDRLGAEFWERYEPLGKWLVRMNVGFDPRGIEKNLILDRIGTVNGMIPDTGNDPIQITGMDVVLKRPVIINEKLLPPGSGVFAEHSSDWQDFQGVHEVMSPRLQAENGIPPHSIDCKSGMQLMLRADGQNTACVMESSVPVLSERGWQASTVRAAEMDRLG